MSANSRGSASILLMVVVLPFLAILAVIGIEMTQFFGMREEVRRLLDSEAKQSLGRPYPSEYVTRRVASRLEVLKPYVEVSDVRATTNSQRGEVVVTGTFNGPLNKFVGFLLRQDAAGIPFTLSTTARRAQTTGVIIFDRTVGEGEDPCGSGSLSVRAGMVSRLARELEALGAQRVTVGVIPGTQGEIDLLTTDDLMPRCGGVRRGYLGVESIEGVGAEAFSDAVAVAYRATQLVFTTAGEGRVEQRAIVMVSPPLGARSEVIPTTFSLLEHESARQSVKVKAVGIVVGGDRERDPFETRSGFESGRATYLHLSEEEVRGGNPHVALVQHIQGQTVIAR